MQRFISIREKLVLFFIILGILSIGVIGYLSYSNARSAILNRTSDQLTSLRIEKKKQIELFFNERKKDLYLLLQDYNIVSSAMNETSPVISDSCKFSKHARKFLNPNIYYGVYIVFPENKRIKFLPFSSNSDFNNVLSYNLILEVISKDSSNKNITLTDFHNQNLQLHSFSVFVKTYVPENNCWVILPISIDAINKIMYEKNPFNGLGKTGETYLVGDDSLMRSTSRFNQNSVNKIKVNTLGVKNAFDGIVNTITIKDYRKIKVLSSFEKINTPGLNWVILAEMDWDEVLIPIYTIRNNILFISLLVSLAFIFIAYIVSLGITRNLRRLNNAVSEVGKGNFNVNLEISTNDEIGELTRSFNKMASQLKQSASELREERINRIRSMIDGQETERLRLSRELHDGLGQQMIGLRLKIENLSNHSKGETAKMATEIGKLMDNTIEEIRNISNDLMPSVLQEFGIANAIRNLCDQISETAQVKINLSISGTYDILSPKQMTYLFRIVQEALNNIVKHANATEVIIKLFQDNSIVYLDIYDNGKGFNQELSKNNSHNGINNMKERAILLNGNMNIESCSGIGTKIFLNFPFSNE